MGNFTKQPQRTGTRSVKWDRAKSIYGSNDVLPMWVADMDFKVPAEIENTLLARVNHGIFGYTITDKQVDEAVINWLKKRHGWDVNRKWLTYSPGVITSLHMAIQALTSVGEQILIQTPVYTPFYHAVEKLDRKLVTNSLFLENDQYRIDFDDFEQKLCEGTKAFILCNPHNPGGRVWTKSELKKMVDLCIQYDVLVFSDEIHSDLIYSSAKHVPIASLSEDASKQTVTLMSPTKTFNLAGLQTSFIVTSDHKKKEKIQRQFGKQGIHFLNTMAIYALEAAYKDGEAWLEELLQVLEENRRYVIDAFKETDQIHAIPPEGTYLIWLDCRNMGKDQAELRKWMKEKAKVGLNDGVSFGVEGEGFMRMNIGCPRETVVEGVGRILAALE
ncbi:PatB family C-S lyase [Aquibacillus sp. 3ASR75-11]|uniref:cysteine-S-conjugate beta-lyase n=1 Tax=Terrihalobacillus insolitus TaxID=2950438 RepID=A0A9X4ALX8_9BACI|nr:PatB family C-S lyase [Terrihalobacillus insolitus]MDC3412387.1 PatB family C-S lyase [Terrihalobacillus insolitus]MDC3422920.1 PatB family C-S lyase [Terrihalobacillus insolitus]